MLATKSWIVILLWALFLAFFAVNMIASYATSLKAEQRYCYIGRAAIWLALCFGVMAWS